jgi:hypothetical protein
MKNYFCDAVCPRAGNGAATVKKVQVGWIYHPSEHDLETTVRRAYDQGVLDFGAY